MKIPFLDIFKRLPIEERLFKTAYLAGYKKATDDIGSYNKALAIHEFIEKLKAWTLEDSAKFNEPPDILTGEKRRL